MHQPLNSVCELQPEGLDAEADAEVDRIVSELTSGILSPAGTVPTESALGSAAKSETVNEEVRYCLIFPNEQRYSFALTNSTVHLHFLAGNRRGSLYGRAAL